MIRLPITFDPQCLLTLFCLFAESVVPANTCQVCQEQVKLWGLGRLFGHFARSAPVRPNIIIAPTPTILPGAPARGDAPIPPALGPFRNYTDPAALERMIFQM